MNTGSSSGTFEAGYVEHAATGDTTTGQFQCAGCGYGVSVRRRLPLCPMCGGTAWEPRPAAAFDRS